MASNFSSVVTNAFEQALSSDMGRSQTLLSREIQNLARDLGRKDTVGNFEGTVVNGFTRDPTLDWSGLGHTTRVGPGSGFFSSLNDVGPDESDYQVIQWPQTDLTHAAPDASFPRIDIITAALGVQVTDLTVRNILVDPVARTVASQTVPKTRNPLSVLTLTTGTPGAVPLPPATPVDQVVIAEVLVPASAASGTTYSRAKALFRRTVAPIAGMNAIVSGCQLTWTPTYPSTLGMKASVSRVVIAGEVIRFTGSQVSVVGDTGANNPFLVAAPATHDKPYYIYLAKGGLAQSGTSLQPVVLIESLVAPTVDGFPAGNLTTPRGATGPNAVFVGCGYVYRGTTFRRECSMDGDWLFAECASSDNNFEIFTSTTQPGLVLLASVPAMHAMKNNGQGRRFGRFELRYYDNASTSAGAVQLKWNSTTGIAPPGLERVVSQVMGISGPGFGAVLPPVDLPFRLEDVTDNYQARVYSSAPSLDWTVVCRPVGYKLSIPRLGWGG